mgnify:CR=1 FL=1
MCWLWLFDKWFEERETQAAELWRICSAHVVGQIKTDSDDDCVSIAITKSVFVAQAADGGFSVKVPVT